MKSNIILWRVSAGHALWCPGCEMLHIIPDNWAFNNNFEKPTFRPSVKHNYTYGTDYKAVVCHYILTDGVLQFMADCTHKLANSSVALLAIPEDYYSKPVQKE